MCWVWIVLRVLEHWVDILVPAVLSEMWNDWAHQDELNLEESQDDEWVCFTTLGDQVILFDRLHFEESELQSLFVFHFIVV
jgi:hypothetical protein